MASKQTGSRGVLRTSDDLLVCNGCGTQYSISSSKEECARKDMVLSNRATGKMSRQSIGLSVSTANDFDSSQLASASRSYEQNRAMLCGI